MLHAHSPTYTVLLLWVSFEKEMVITYWIKGYLNLNFLIFQGERMAAQLRKDLFAKMMVQDMAFFDSHKSQDIISRLTLDVQEFKSSFKMVVSQGMYVMIKCFFENNENPIFFVLINFRA